MNYPPRLGHLATRAVVVAKWLPTYATSHQIEDDEALERLQKAFSGRLYEDMLSATWDALMAETKRLDENGLLEKIARGLKDRPLRPGRLGKESPELSAFLVVLDIHAGTASDAARRLMERPESVVMTERGMKHAGKLLAAELTRK